MKINISKYVKAQGKSFSTPYEVNSIDFDEDSGILAFWLVDEKTQETRTITLRVIQND